jgi:toxin-antitoxin system PIN domain toxin
MLLVDANVLINAYREDAVDHAAYYAWLDGVFRAHRSFALPDIVAAAFVRIVTNPRIFHNPEPVERALANIEDLQARSECVWLRAEDRHWAIFADLCRKTHATGNLITDAWLAALAIEQDCELISADRDFARFPGLRWRHPFDPPAPPE